MKGPMAEIGESITREFDIQGKSIVRSLKEIEEALVRHPYQTIGALALTFGYWLLMLEVFS